MKVMSSSFSSVRILLVSVFLTLVILLAGCGQGDPVDAESPLIEDFAIAYLKRPVESLDTLDISRLDPNGDNSDGRGPRAVPRFPVELERDPDTNELIPGIGKTYMKVMLDERERRKFESYVDLQERVGLKEPIKHISKRILEEITGETRMNLFVKR